MTAHSMTLSMHMDTAPATWAWTCPCGQSGRGELDYPGATYNDARAAAGRDYYAHLDTAVRYFTDPVSGSQCALVIPPGGRIIPPHGRAFPGPGDPKIGVIHPRCDTVADLVMELDAFFCPECGWNGRVSGAWCADAIAAAR